MIELLDQFVPVERNNNATLPNEMLGGRDLVVISGFTQITATGHHDNRFAEFEGGDDGSHPGVSHHYLGRFNPPAEFRWVEEARSGNMPRTVIGRANLREYI